MLLIKIVEKSYNALNVISDNFMYEQSIKRTPGSRNNELLTWKGKEDPGCSLAGLLQAGKVKLADSHGQSVLHSPETNWLLILL